MMLASLLQIMGFTAALPVHSRAEEDAPATVARSAPDPATPPAIANKTKNNQVNPARRPTVKAQTAKSAANAEPSAEATRPAGGAVKAVAKTPAAKPAAATANATVAVSKKAIASDGQTPGVTKVIRPILKKKPEEVSKKIQAEPMIAVTKAAPSPMVAKAAASAPVLSPLGVPVRSGRPSSRLAQLTVPSMAQSVASTAAKSSFTQISTPAPITQVVATPVKRDPALANNWKSKPVADLSDAEVIAMPDDEYMNDTQMAFFRLKLVRLKDDILSNAGETTEHLREDTVVVPDPADRATIEEEHALELRTRDRERKLLKKIQQSINRIDAGDYGYCDETGEPIGVGRLLARPTATLSLEAQQRRELKQKMFGD